METVTNAASTAVNTASKIIFGDTAAQQSGTEPKSGETGAKDQPYDAGNIEPGNPGQNTNTTDASSKDTPSTGERSNVVNNPGAATEQKSATSGTAGGFGTAEPSVSADPQSAQKPEQKQEGADRPTDKPTGEEKDAVKDKKDEDEAALAKRDPNDHSGEPMRMHGGDEKRDEGGNDDGPQGQEGGGEHGKEKGTGEKYVKSTGLQAEGGDFDASKPGAGREADRLLEEKGINRDDPSKGPPSPEISAKSPTRSEKVSKLDKIKEKLHIGKKDKS